MLSGIIPIVFVPFDSSGQIDPAGLRRIVQFELAGGADGLGINGFASEAYKLSDAERQRTAEIVTYELGGAIPLVIGLAAGSTEAAIAQARDLEALGPAAYMVLPPSTMNNGPQALIDHYVHVAQATEVPLMVQQSPHIPQYAHCLLSAEQLAEMVHRSMGIRYFKIEGGGASERMQALAPLLPPGVGLFGGVGGLTFLDELEAGAAGVIPGVGFNEVFQQAWAAWKEGQRARVRERLTHYQPLVSAVSSKGHEFSLHARKRLMQRLGLIESAYVRSPSIQPSEAEILEVFAVADQYQLRIAQPEIKPR
ncbi:MAG: dihydrodipicolinate synthase family protein [Thermaceae bacterium]|nr:dihydrodipicolinate synthase family protein [Thermaceae bacterium]